MSVQQHLAIKAILTNPLVGATTSDIEKLNVVNVASVISQLRKKGHQVVSVKRSGKTFYTLPFGTRDQSAKLTKAQRETIEFAVSLQQLAS
jgi:hypothetical protein